MPAGPAAQSRSRPHKNGRCLGFLLLLSLAGSSAGAQERVNPEGPRKQAIAVRMPSSAVIRVDGRLNEPVWTQASAIDDFVQKEPTENAPPSERMEIQFLYDEEALYVGARMHKQAGSRIQAPMGRRDRGEQAEYILVALDTFLDHRTAYAFGVTAAGVRIDRFHQRDDETAYDEGFDPVWRAATSTDEQGWAAELWIPFSQLRFNVQERLVWGLNVHRFTPTLDEDDYWVATPRTVTAWSSRFGELRGLEGIKAPRRLEILPFVAASSTVNSNRDAANPFDNGVNGRGRVGADLKMGLGPNLTLAATFNPDFGQVEADPAEVNLTAVPTFFTEKRPFFLEDADALNLVVNTSPSFNGFFYSRRIGAPPIGTATGDFVDAPETSTILGAAKLTGRLPSGTSIGILAAVTNSETARTFNRTSLVQSRVPVGPRTEYGLARVQQEFGPNNSTVGGTVTVVHRDFADGDRLAALLVRNAFAIAGDSILRFKGGRYELTMQGGTAVLTGDAAAIDQVQRSSAHYLQHPDSHYTGYDPTKTSLQGIKAGVMMRKTGGRHWIWSGFAGTESPGLDLNDLGRLGTADGRQITSDLRYRETVPSRLFRGYWVGVSQTNEWTYGGDHDSATARLYTNQTWKNFWSTQISYSTNFRREDPRLTRGGPVMQVPFGGTTDFQLHGAPSRQTGWSTEVAHTWDEDGGKTDRFSGHLSVRPGPSWQLSIEPNLSHQVQTQQYVTAFDGGRPATYGRRYVFGGIDRTTYSMQFRVGYTLRPDVNVDVYAEPFAASGRYSNIGELAVPRTRQRLLYGTGGTTAAVQPDGSLLVTDGAATFKIANNDFNVHSYRSNVVLRWEYRPGSMLYVVWQQNRRLSEPLSGRVSIADPFRSLTVPGSNYFIVKTSFWIPVR